MKDQTTNIIDTETTNDYIERTEKGIIFHVEGGDLFLKFDEIEMFLIYPERCEGCTHFLFFHPLGKECILKGCPCPKIFLLDKKEEPWYTKHNLSSEKSPDTASAIFSGMS